MTLRIDPASYDPALRYSRDYCETLRRAAACYGRRNEQSGREMLSALRQGFERRGQRDAASPRLCAAERRTQRRRAQQARAFARLQRCLLK